MSRALIAACALLLATEVTAQPVEALEPGMDRALDEPNGSLRLSAGLGLLLVVGPDAEVNGAVAPDTSPYVSLPASAVGRIDLPVHDNLLLGVQTSFMFWRSEIDRAEGTRHETFDVSAVVRARWPLGSYGRHELLISVPVGASLHRCDGVQLKLADDYECAPGWHFGAFAGYQLAPVRSVVGFFVEAGLTYYSLSTTIEDAIEGRGRVTEEIAYHPVALFVRSGVMLLPTQ